MLLECNNISKTCTTSTSQIWNYSIFLAKETKPQIFGNYPILIKLPRNIPATQIWGYYPIIFHLPSAKTNRLSWDIILS